MKHEINRRTMIRFLTLGLLMFALSAPAILSSCAPASQPHLPASEPTALAATPQPAPTGLSIPESAVEELKDFGDSVSKENDAQRENRLNKIQKKILEKLYETEEPSIFDKSVVDFRIESFEEVTDPHILTVTEPDTCILGVPSDSWAGLNQEKISEFCVGDTLPSARYLISVYRIKTSPQGILVNEGISSWVVVEYTDFGSKEAPGDSVQLCDGTWAGIISHDNKFINVRALMGGFGIPRSRASLGFIRSDDTGYNLLPMLKGSPPYTTGN